MSDLDKILLGISEKIIQSYGEDSNGSWIKLTNGIMICNMRAVWTVNDSTVSKTIAYPQPFIESPSCIGATTANMAYITGQIQTYNAISVTLKGKGTYGGANCAMNIQAIGKWK